ncbi:unnamed protein product [Owenia fusiformis]|uniref:Uncharacterized protein n=1 Tax=Owenia fusiformis TaxID=6347 RepID=A0A8J1XI91_OWEFU|nr:unnamed protein product [Owenia fusiformis]
MLQLMKIVLFGTLLHCMSAIPSPVSGIKDELNKFMNDYADALLLPKCATPVNTDCSYARTFWAEDAILAVPGWRSGVGRDGVMHLLEVLVKSKNPYLHIRVTFDEHIKEDKQSATGYGHGTVYSKDETGALKKLADMRCLLHFLKVDDRKKYKIQYWVENIVHSGEDKRTT